MQAIWKMKPLSQVNTPDTFQSSSRYDMRIMLAKNISVYVAELTHDASQSLIKSILTTTKNVSLEDNHLVRR